MISRSIVIKEQFEEYKWYLLRSGLNVAWVELPNGDVIMSADTTLTQRQQFLAFSSVIPMPNPQSQQPLSKNVADKLSHVNAKEGEAVYAVFTRLHEAHGKHPILDPDI